MAILLARSVLDACGARGRHCSCGAEVALVPPRSPGAAVAEQLAPVHRRARQSSPLGSRRVEVVIDEHRIGNSFGQDWQWLPLEDISRVKRFGDVWVIASSDTVIDIPVSAIDERCMARLRR
jgi:hypothetical protein